MILVSKNSILSPCSETVDLSIVISTDRLSDIYIRIKNNYNAEELHLARRLEHLRYLHQCKESRFLPRFLISRPPVCHPKARDIAIRTGWAYLRLIISNCHHRLGQLAKDRLSISGEIERVIDANHFETLWQAISKRCSYHVQVISKRHDRKFVKSTNKQDECIKKKWVTNISQRVLTKDEISLLRKGLNFAVTPKSVPTKEILASV